MMAVNSDANVKTRALDDMSALICKYMYFIILGYLNCESDSVILSHIFYNYMLSKGLEVMFYYLFIVHILVIY